MMSKWSSQTELYMTDFRAFKTGTPQTNGRRERMHEQISGLETFSLIIVPAYRSHVSKAIVAWINDTSCNCYIYQRQRSWYRQIKSLSLGCPQVSHKRGTQENRMSYEKRQWKILESRWQLWRIVGIGPTSTLFFIKFNLELGVRKKTVEKISCWLVKSAWKGIWRTVANSISSTATNAVYKCIKYALIL